MSESTTIHYTVALTVPPDQAEAPPTVQDVEDAITKKCARKGLPVQALAVTVS